MFYTATSFEQRLSSFKERKITKSYRSYLTDVKRALKRFSSFEDAYSAHDLVLQVNRMALIKYRINDSQNRLGANNGYRLIFLCIPQEDENKLAQEQGRVYLLDLYPKRGPLGTNNLTDDRFVDLVRLCLEDIQEDRCLSFDLD